MKFMDEYTTNSGQVVNRAKSLLLLGKYAIPRQYNIQRILGIVAGSLPFTYLGLPIFRGCPKCDFFSCRLLIKQSKLSTWKGMQLSQAARLQLINSVIQGQLINIYSFQVYEWPSSLLRKAHCWIHNFFLDWGPFKTRFCVGFLEQLLYTSKEQGGLRIKNIFLLNHALLLKKCWDLGGCIESFSIGYLPP